MNCQTVNWFCPNDCINDRFVFDSAKGKSKGVLVHNPEGKRPRHRRQGEIKMM